MNEEQLKKLAEQFRIWCRELEAEEAEGRMVQALKELTHGDCT